MSKKMKMQFFGRAVLAAILGFDISFGVRASIWVFDFSTLLLFIFNKYDIILWVISHHHQDC